MQIHGIEFDEGRIAELCRQAGVTRLYLFGSILSDRFGAESDIDLLAETDARNPPGMLALGGLQMDLSDLLGRTVHLTLFGGLPQEHRGPVLAHARAIHAA